MQISITTAILESLFTHATTAARLGSYINNRTPVADALTKSIDEIIRTVAGLLGKPYSPRPAGEPTTQLLGRPYATRPAGEPPQDGEPEFNVNNAVDDLRQLVARADALANAAESLFEETTWGNDDGDHRRLEHLAHLIGATSDAVQVAADAGDKLAAELSTRRPGA